MSLQDEIKNLRCPYCDNGNLETTVSLGFVEGKGLWHVHKQRQLIGCCSCVAKKAAQEITLSKGRVNGSPSAYALNLMYPSKIKTLISNIKKDLGAVRSVLSESGISELPENINSTDIAYSIATAMIKADGRIEESEVTAAIDVGKEKFPDFDEAAFRKRLNSYKFLPTIEDLSLLLKIVLDRSSKQKLLRFLVAISVADGDVADEEVELLKTISVCLDLNEDVTQLLSSAMPKA